MKNEEYSIFPKTTKSKRDNRKYKTIERENIPRNLYSGKISHFSKNKILRDSSNSPAVPIPSHSRLTSHSNKIKQLENSLTSDLKMVSTGLNFEIEPFEKPGNIPQKSKLSQRRQIYEEFIYARVNPHSRATVSELNQRLKETKQLKKDIEERIRLRSIPSSLST
jgi:hypothetical protein